MSKMFNAIAQYGRAKPKKARAQGSSPCSFLKKDAGCTSMNMTLGYALLRDRRVPIRTKLIVSAGARQSTFYLFDWRFLQMDFWRNFWMYVF